MASSEAVSGQRLLKKPRLFQFKRRQRTYIVPSRFGLAFGVMALVLFFMALGYANNLIYIFVFFMISVAFTGMLLTNRNVQILTASPQELRALPLFAQEKGTLFIPIKNKSKAMAWDIQVQFEKTADSVPYRLPPQSENEIQLSISPRQRGWQTVPRVNVQSTYPFGLLRAWQVFKVEQKILVYPARRGSKTFPQDSVGEEALQKTGLFRDHRVFQSSDPVRRIDWRASARRQELLVKNFEEPEKPQLRFSWEQTRALADFEARISQLTLWIDEAEKQRHAYSLILGARQFPFESGPIHYARCLEALALLQEEDLL